MKRLILGSLPLLLILGTTAPAVRAENVAADSAASGRTSSRLTQTTPFNLVHLAYRGYFQNEGIPSYATLISAHQAGQISAEDLVNVAIKTNRLSSDVLSDRGYLIAVEATLDDLNNPE